MRHDLIIIGASAAGVAASVYASRRGLDFVLLSEDVGGEVATSGEIENYLGFPQTDGIALTEKFKEQLKHNKIERQQGVVQNLEQKDGGFLVKANNIGKPVELEAKAVLVATGVHPRELSVAGEKEFRGKGVTYCTTCDGPLFKDKVTATIGGGNAGLESVLMMEQIASKVYILQRSDKLKGDQVLIDKVMKSDKITVLLNAKTTEIFGDTFVKGLKYKNEAKEMKELAVEGIFVHIGMIPNSSFVDFADKNEVGEIKVSANCLTNVPGLFAAGDVTNVPYKQISIAAGQGTCAALAAVDYLNKLT